ncbi:MAG TPA: hypothetical protein VE338_19620 [Ktedonobacterales bacterium]|jgi:uncharacterized membrane protein|nr:hypothetical protein [Ktedonobacterales bacterium]
MADSRAIVDGESPLESFPNRVSRQPDASAEAIGANQPVMRRAKGYSQDRTRVDIPALSALDEGPDPSPANAPAPPPWPGPAAQLPAAQAPFAPPAPPAPMTHAPWTAAPSWGASSLNTPNMLAGLSYLFWWVSGLYVYFNERHNRFVRFHAVQSILLTGALTVVSVAFYILWELSADLSAATRQPAFAHVGQGVAFLGFLGVIALWLGPMFAAWSGHHVRLPIVGAYAERYAAPPREPYTSAPFDD